MVKVPPLDPWLPGHVDRVFLTKMRLNGLKCGFNSGAYLLHCTWINDVVANQVSRSKYFAFGDRSWPPRSCDLTCLDYLLRGFLKSMMYAPWQLRNSRKKFTANSPIAKCSCKFLSVFSKHMYKWGSIRVWAQAQVAPVVNIHMTCGKNQPSQGLC